MKKQYKTHLLICSEQQHEKDLSHYPFRSAGVVSPSYAGTAGRQWKAVSGTWLQESRSDRADISKAAAQRPLRPVSSTASHACARCTW